MDTLVLSASWEPVGRVPWERAVTLMFERKVELIEAYEDRKLRSANDEWKMPSVIRFIRAHKRNRKGVKFSRENIYARDGGKCAYCVQPVSRSDFTYDHVLPKSQGGETNWLNIVVSCTPCNQKKKNRTPAQAGMRMPTTLYKPKLGQLNESLMFQLSWHPGMPESWKSFMRDTTYWKGEMQADGK